MNIRCQVYVDDFIVLSKPCCITSHTDTVLNTLTDLGFIVNYEKSNLVPSSSILYIGFVINSSGASGFPEVWLAPARVAKLRHSIRRLRARSTCSARQLARVLGQCVSMCMVVSFGKVMLRHSYALLRLKTDWECLLTINEDTHTELQWWLDEMASPRPRKVLLRPVQCQLLTDASQTGWGASLSGQPATGYWNTRVSYEPSNYRELLAVLLALLSFEGKIRNQCVELLTDNITAKAYVSHQGGPHMPYNYLAKAIWGICSRSNILLVCSHIKGVLNVQADLLSRVADPYSWKLDEQIFRTIDHLLPVADALTTQLPRYNSRYLDPESAGVNCLSQLDWAK
jgi:hypothetical protein